MMYKKMFLDQDNAKSLSFDDLESMKSQIMGTLDFTNQSMQLLKRKGDVISKIFAT